MIIVVIDLFDYHSTFVLCSGIIFFRFTHPAPLRARGEPAPVLRLAAVQTQKKGKIKKKQGFDGDVMTMMIMMTMMMTMITMICSGNGAK